MRVLVLGAGQDVGKSCVVVRIGGKTFMFDCGMHLGYSDQRRFPDFSLLSPSGDNFTSLIDAVFITHFHLDHVGALPYFTEVCGYSGPIYMTHPTRAISPLMLEDYYRVLLDRPGTGPLFAKHHIAAAMNKVTLMDLQETVEVCPGVEVTAYNAGHVLGAAMLHVTVGAESVLYTGDFNSVPDRHLSGAALPRLAPDLLISESTYAASVREGRAAREHSLLMQIHDCVSQGGKVLVPVFAVGRAQELMLLINDYWDKTQLNVPIYMSGPLAARANQYYRLLLNWTSGRVKQSGLGSRPSAFAFDRAQQWNTEYIHRKGPCVLFATPGMLQGGTSLEVFKAWAPDHKNLLLLPSYQVAGTVGRKLMLGQRKELQVDNTTIDVNCKVHYAAVSAHSDAKGILQLIQQVSPAAVMLVHGESDKMTFMSNKVQSSLGIRCYMPAVGDEVEIDSRGVTRVAAAQQLLRKLPMSVQQLQQTWQQQQQQGKRQQRQQQGIAQDGMPDVQGAGVITAEAKPSRFSDSLMQDAAEVENAQQQQQQQQTADPAADVSQGSISSAAATWLKQGDMQQLVTAAMKLAGLGAIKHSQSTAAAAAGNSVELQEKVQQQQQQQLPVSAAARAAQLAPWLELLAAAAQEVQQKQQHSTPPQQQQGELPMSAGHLLGNKQSSNIKLPISSTLATLTHQLQQQINLESHGTVVDGVLIVKHQQPETPAGRPLVKDMQLLPAGAAAELLGIQQHHIKQTCRIRIPLWCLRPYIQQQQQQQQDGDDSVVAKMPVISSAMTAAAAAVFVSDILKAGLPGTLSQLVTVQHNNNHTVQLRTIHFSALSGSPAAAAAVRDGSSDDEEVTVTCRWYLQDDSLAVQCISLLKLATRSTAAVAGKAD